MRISKSLAVLASSADTASPDRKRQARRRSSLDTFVIPGRTRLPSSRVSQPEPMDLKIAENLLNAESRVPPRKSSDPNRRSVLNPPKCRRSDAKTARTEDDEDLTPDSPPRFHLDVSALPHSGTGSHLDEVPGTFEVNDIDEHPGSRPRRHVGGGSSGHTVGQQDLSLSYDGPNDASSNGSRNTTSTWTTVSHRNFTSSSAGSQRLGSGPSILEYNRLATEHGLVELAEAPDCLASESHNSLEISSATRAHHHGWIVRKLLRRPSSLYSFKATKIVIPDLRRKRSVCALSGIQPRPRKDILKDRSLEEISRLGGLSILALPHDFAAVDKLVLPSCISATAHYLVQHGCTVPGIFRVPGQLSTINALYDYYSNRFLNYSNIDDPDKIQSTVGTGDLPAHIEFTVHDVASLLKKILLGLPGGLLGSLSLFKVICSIDTKVQRGLEQSVADFITFKARLIALAISSVTSDHRFSLICAILGLAALIGHESEKVANGGPSNYGPSSELMGYRALGVVLGPLLLGDDINDILGSETLEGQNAQASDSSKKSRRQKRGSTIEQKLGQNEALLAHVEKAKITAKMGEMLISMWRDVVKQLRNLAVNGTSDSQHRDSEPQPTSGRSRFTLSSSQDGFIRGTQQSDVFVESSGSAKKVKLSSWQSRPSRGSRHSSSSKGGDWLHEACVTDSGDDRPLLGSTGRKTSKPRQLHFPYTDGRKVSKVRFAGHSGIGLNHGTSLQHDEGAPIPDELILKHPFVTADITHVHKPPYETAEEVENPFASEHGSDNYSDLLRSKLLSSQAAASLDRASPGSHRPSHGTPHRNSGMSTTTQPAGDGDEKVEARLSQTNPIESIVQIPPEGSQEHAQLLADSFGDLGRLNEIDGDKGLLISSTGPPRKPPARGEASFYDHALSGGSRRNSVRLLAQRFSQSSQGHYVQELSYASQPPRVCATVYAAPIETQSSPPPVAKKDTPPPTHTATTETHSLPPQVLENNTRRALHHSNSDLVRGKESLIPRPVREIGRGRRKGESRSPSPIKERPPATQVRKTGSQLNIVSDDYLATTFANGLGTSGDDIEPTNLKSSITELASSTPQWTPRGPGMRKAHTMSSLKTSSPLDALMRSTNPGRLPSVSSSSAPSESKLPERGRSPSISQDSNTASSHHLSPALRTNTTSTSAFLVAEIRRLQRQLEKKNEEVSQVRRNLDVVKEAGSTRERSCSHEGNTYGDDVRKELESWKRRAVEAERKLGKGSEDDEQRYVEVPKDWPRTLDESTAADAAPLIGPEKIEKSLGEILLAGAERSQEQDVQKRIEPSKDVPQTPDKRSIFSQTSGKPTGGMEGSWSPASGAVGKQALDDRVRKPIEISRDGLQTPERSPDAEGSGRKGKGSSEQSPSKVSRVAFVEPSPRMSSNESGKQKRSDVPSGPANAWRNL